MPYIDLGPVVGPQGAQGETGAQGVRGEQGLPGPNQLTNQTATPLTGVLVGSGGVVNVRPIDATPTDNSEGIPTSGGVFNALNTRVPVYGMGRNLLDNWYFGNPVNQRGASSYSTDGAYTLDRWKLGGAAGTASVSNQGVLLTNATAISQFFEQTRVMSGKTYTMSVLWSNGLSVATGTLTHGTQTSGWQIAAGGTVTTARSCGIRVFNSENFQIAIFGDGTNRVIAVKLELGTEQTLCHNEGTAENPVWVLNEIPDYGEELRKCQRYLVRYDSSNSTGIATIEVQSATTAGCVLYLPVTMRNTTPTITTGGLRIFQGSSDKGTPTISNVALIGNILNLTLTASGMTAPSVARFLLYGSSYLQISCEL